MKKGLVGGAGLEVSTVNATIRSVCYGASGRPEASAEGANARRSRHYLGIL